MTKWPGVGDNSCMTPIMDFTGFWDAFLQIIISFIYDTMTVATFGHGLVLTLVIILAVMSVASWASKYGTDIDSSEPWTD